MNFDKQEHKNAVLALFEQSQVPAVALDQATELRDAIRDATVGDQRAAIISELAAQLEIPETRLRPEPMEHAHQGPQCTDGPCSAQKM